MSLYSYDGISTVSSAADLIKSGDNIIVNMLCETV